MGKANHYKSSMEVKIVDIQCRASIITRDKIKAIQRYDRGRGVKTSFGEIITDAIDGYYDYCVERIPGIELEREYLDNEMWEDAIDNHVKV